MVPNNRTLDFSGTNQFLPEIYHILNTTQNTGSEQRLPFTKGRRLALASPTLPSLPGAWGYVAGAVLSHSSRALAVVS